jgi:[ribosomal protein S18]-alanine N-acetyltransferase
MQLTVRPMRPRDLPRVMEIEEAAYTTPWSEDTFRGLLRRSDTSLLVADVNDAIAGYAVFWAVLDQGELGNIAVADEFRRRGIATRLLESVLEVARDRTVREVFLEGRASNAHARALYEKHGFAEVDRRPGYYTGPIEDALVMRVRLNDGG